VWGNFNYSSLQPPLSTACYPAEDPIATTDAAAAAADADATTDADANAARAITDEAWEPVLHRRYWIGRTQADLGKNKFLAQQINTYAGHL